MTCPPVSPTNTRLWLGLSIGSALMCCVGLGVPGIVFSAMELDAEKRGDYATARRKLATARRLTVAAIVIGAITTPAYIYWSWNQPI